MFQIEEDSEFFLSSTSKRRLLMSTGALTPKTTRDTIGVQVMTLRSPHRVQAVAPYREGMSAKPDRYRTRSLPAAGALPATEDVGEQLTF